jgi:hypothetical protein
MTTRLVIAYEVGPGDIREALYEDPPSLHDQRDGLVFAKGVLADRKIEYKRILEILRSNVIYSAYEEGLEALREV